MALLCGGLSLGLWLNDASASDKCKDKDCKPPKEAIGKGMGRAGTVKPAPPRVMKSPSMKAKASAGVSVGGVQDIGYARKQIKSGLVPGLAAFTPEGILSEHDFSLLGGACEQLFCLRPDAAQVELLPEKEPWTVIQLGLDSGIDLESFSRAPQNLVVVLDRSGSMGGDKIAAARTALDRLVDKMGDKDRLGVVLFDDKVDVLFSSELMTDKAKKELRKKILEVEARGGTNIDIGLKAGYEMAALAAGKKGVSDRVLLFTDAQPNIGPTTPEHFAGLAKSNGEKNVGLTMFGVGVDFGYSVAELTSSVRGANYVFLEDAKKLEKVFDQDFDFLVTPIAHDFSLSLEAGPGYAIEEAYGIPRTKDKLDLAEIKVASLFLSKEKGVIAVKVRQSDVKKAGKEVAYLSLSYTPLGGARISSSAQVNLSEQAGPGVRKVGDLLSMIRTIRAAYDSYHKKDTSGAIALLKPLAEHLDKESTNLNDKTLHTEAELVWNLIKNMEKPASPPPSFDDDIDL
jgi:Ca-activated chloride channel family protein